MVRKKLKLTEAELTELISQVIQEQSYGGGIIQQGDEPCEIWCKRKVAMRRSRGDVVKMIQHLLARGCGVYGPYNPEKMGGGMNEGCAENWTNCDGKFEKETKKAVEAYQRDMSGLGVDGKVGYNTLNALCELCYKPTVYPDDFTLCDRQCGCEDQQQNIKIDDIGGDDILDVVDGDDWFIDIDIPAEYGKDCDKIKSCLDYASGKDTRQWEFFINCMNEGTKKPDWFKSSCMKWIPYDWEKGGIVICISGQGNSFGPYKGHLVFPDGEPGDYYKNFKASEELKKLGINVDQFVAASECCSKRRWRTPKGPVTGGKLNEQKHGDFSIWANIQYLFGYGEIVELKAEIELAQKKATELAKEYEVGELKPGITKATNYTFMKGHCERYCEMSEIVHEEFMSKHITDFGEEEAYLLMRLIEGVELCEFDDMHEGAVGLGCNYIKKDLELMLKMLGYKRAKKKQ